MSEALAVLCAQQASYAVGRSRLVDGVSLKVRAGEIVGLLGPNGAGKSTFLKLVSRELDPASGTLLLHGRDLRGYRTAELASLRAVVTQSSKLDFPFSAREVVMLGATVPGFGLKRPEIDAACARAMRAVDAQHLANRAYPLLSGGERQRVQIARALCQLSTARRPSDLAPLLLLDEPTSSLDIAHQRLVLDTARALANEGTAILVVLHDLNLAAAYCDRLVMMVRGRVLASGSPRDVIVSSVLSEAYGCAIHANQLPVAGTPFALPVVQTNGVPA